MFICCYVLVFLSIFFLEKKGLENKEFGKPLNWIIFKVLPISLKLLFLLVLKCMLLPYNSTTNMFRYVSVTSGLLRSAFGLFLDLVPGLFFFYPPGD